MVKTHYIKQGSVFVHETPYGVLNRTERLVLILQDFKKCKKNRKIDVVIIPILDLGTGEIHLTRFSLIDGHVLCLFRYKGEKKK